MSIVENVRSAMVFATVRLVFISIPLFWFGGSCTALVTIIGLNSLASPWPLSDSPPNLLRRFLLAMHLGGEECLPNADTATCRVIRLEAVQETAMFFPLAVAIARLLCQHFRYFFRRLICLPYLR